jgi:hypothetical protein
MLAKLTKLNLGWNTTNQRRHLRFSLIIAHFRLSGEAIWWRSQQLKVGAITQGGDSIRRGIGVIIAGSHGVFGGRVDELLQGRRGHSVPHYNYAFMSCSDAGKSVLRETGEKRGKRVASSCVAARRRDAEMP